MCGMGPERLNLPEKHRYIAKIFNFNEQWENLRGRANKINKYESTQNQKRLNIPDPDKKEAEKFTMRHYRFKSNFPTK
jgi:hypothetical protein